ncbi:MAG: hypothetical protein EOM21_13005 [Gammaproteobacteria bacterium]|nr:hypothetical protein [Gammaproteobacteria bacterium]
MQATSESEAGRETCRVRFPFTVVGSDWSLTKRFFRDPDGSLRKVPSGTLTRGEVRVYWRDSLDALLEALDGLPPSAAAIWGLPQINGVPVSHVNIATKDTRVEGEIARTREFFDWPAGPGILMIDIDGSPEDGIPVREAAVDTLRGLHPAFADVTIAWRPSASSGVDGAGIKGQRLYLVMQDARVLATARSILNDLQWVKGLGRVEITTNGHLVRRGFMDASVWKPEWLDFAAPPVLDDGITREPLGSFVCEGSRPMVDLAALLPDAESLRSEAEERWRAARLARADEARAVRRAYIEATGRTWLNRDPLQDEHLGPDFPLITAAGLEVRVRDLLADPARWHRAEFHDPYEPEYQQDPRIAVALLQGDYAFPIIYSHAHGGAKYRLFDAEATFAGLEEPATGLAGCEDDEEDLAEAPVEPQLARLRRLQAGERLEVAARSLEERTLVYDSVLEALMDPTVNTVHAATGSGKTRGLAAAVGAPALLREGGPPAIIVCGTALHNIDNFVKEIVAILLEQFLPKHREAGCDDDAANEMAMQEIEPLLERCARVQHNRKLNPLRDRDGTYNYALILCTYGAIHRIGAAIDSRGRLLRLLAGMRRLEEKHGLLSEPILVYGDEADAGLAGSAMTLPLQHRRARVVDRQTGKGRYEAVARCNSACLVCEHVPKIYAAEAARSGVKQLVIEPWVRSLESHVELTLDWLPRAVGPMLAEEGNYEIYGIREEELPAIDPVVKETAEDGTEWARIDPEGQVVRWMRQPGATLRRLLPKDRRSGRLLHPREIEEGADIQWPTFPCEVWFLVSWDREAFSDLATLCMSAPKLLSASFSIGTLAMVDHAFGPQQHSWVPTPEDRKMRHVHLSAAADTLFFGQEMIEALVANSHVLWVEQTEKKAKAFYKIACAWTSTRVKPTLYSGGAYSQIEVFTHNFIITHVRSSLARGANLGHCGTVVIHAD